MKKLARIAFVSLAFMAISCSSSDDGGSSSDETYIKWTLNGTSYNVIEPETLTSLSTLIRVQQGDSDQLKEIDLWMPNTATVGTHPLELSDMSDADEEYTAIVYDGFDNRAESVTGTLNITSIDGEYIKGTFTFTGVTADGVTYNVTNGSFRAFAPSTN